MNFDQAFRKLLGVEGGFSNHPADPGGQTRYGISEAVARAAGYRGDMRDLPVSLAQEIYRREYWDAVRADELPPALRYAVFDAAVNSGVKQAAKWLQRAIGAADDGIVGPQTITMARAAQPDFVKRRMLAQRLTFMTNLPQWPQFSRGWARRIAEVMET